MYVKLYTTHGSRYENKKLYNSLTASFKKVTITFVAVAFL